MSVPVEAQSLSALTNLFSHPPQYPRNPTHKVREPLVLYIVRVPGSKDVFLTPLKPPTKASISLEAIQTSLYYLHVRSEEDEELERFIEEQQRYQEENERIYSPVNRKPLPSVPHANYPESARPLPPPKSYPSYQPGLEKDPSASQSERYVARGVHLRFGGEPATENRGIGRKPQSPRRGLPLGFLDTSAGRSDEELGTRASSAQSPPYDPGSMQTSQQQYVSSHPLARTRAQSNPASNQVSPVIAQGRSSTERLQTSLAVTLIRRDPVSGCQWNVGSISLGEVRGANTPLDPVQIEIHSPGYRRFASVPELPRPGTGRSDAGSIKDAMVSGRLDDEPHGESTGQHTFTRVAAYQQQPVTGRPFKLHRRTDSSDSFNKPPSPSKQLRQVFSFMSPWQGICSFSTGIDGRSLKCRHTLSSSVYTDEDTTVNVAELRFNLPWSVVTSSNERSSDSDAVPISDLLGPKSGKETIKRGLQHFKNFGRDLSRDLNDRKSSSEDRPVLQEVQSQPRMQCEMDRLSLKLAREKAGGGFNGQSAKLGKLIIEDEGLKMCDLLVAACMGVWWQHYEGKVDRPGQL